MTEDILSTTYFNILPEELIVTILCNFTFDKSVHSMIKLLSPQNKEKFYRKICIRFFPELGIYPEEITINEINIFWEKLYPAIGSYARSYLTLDIFDFYWTCFNDEIFLLMLYEYTLRPSDELALFIDTIMIGDIVKISPYYRTYFSGFLDNLNKKRTKLLMEKVKDFGPSPKASTDSFGTYRIDSEGRTVVVKIYEDEGDIYIYFCGSGLDRHEMYKRGYLGRDNIHQ